MVNFWKRGDYKVEYKCRSCGRLVATEEKFAKTCPFCMGELIIKSVNVYDYPNDFSGGSANRTFGGENKRLEKQE